MNRDTFLGYHKEATHRMHEICKRKNADYAGGREGADAFANFRVVECMGIATTEQGILTRMSDKLARLATFSQTGKLAVADESIHDTLLDLANYAIILAAYLDDKVERTKPERWFISTDGTKIERIS